ncbi:phage baseplate assembly protein V [Streptomyces sp. NPDC059680]|uniref:phage baseplate assembly protein V n=1 Tax=Streptomyces TaxID=1883 RepID=UPI001E61BED7|nr:phage baseplate assembly protein V [Streptomyces barringtoniae]MCC5480612.1 phage baseplate assembly protein V [Streptomyces barringtoniae]
MAAEPTRYLGKYRGTVVSNADPMGVGRLQVQVPDVLGDVPSTWAMPCFPLAGPGMGQFHLPPVGSGVWVEFEQGDPSYPIWTGCWYGAAHEVPEDAVTATNNPNVVLQTPGLRQIVLSDEPGGKGITLKHPSGASIVIDDTGVHISNGQGAVISLVGPTVTINNDALSVT